MFCKNCGERLTEGTNFCTKCGFQVNENLVTNNQRFTDNTVVDSSSNKLSKRSNILGIIALISSVLISIFSLIFSIPSIVAGVKYRNKNNKIPFGVYLSLISLVVTIAILVVTYICIDKYGYDELMYRIDNGLDLFAPVNPLVGDFNCRDIDSSSTDPYDVSLYLNKDNTFTYGPYGDLYSNHAKGTYTFKEENKPNDIGVKYYMLTFTGSKDDFVVDGVKSDKDFNVKMEMGLTTADGKKMAVIIFPSSYNIYYCYEK